MRIVKKGAIPIEHSENHYTASMPNMDGSYLEIYEAYKKSDTIIIEKGWRPEEFDNPYRKTFAYPQDIVAAVAFEAGFDACIEAMEAKSHESVKH